MNYNQRIGSINKINDMYDAYAFGNDGGGSGDQVLGKLVDLFTYFICVSGKIVTHTHTKA